MSYYLLSIVPILILVTIFYVYGYRNLKVNNTVYTSNMLGQIKERFDFYMIKHIESCVKISMDKSLIRFLKEYEASDENRAGYIRKEIYDYIVNNTGYSFEPIFLEIYKDGAPIISEPHPLISNEFYSAHVFPALFDGLYHNAYFIYEGAETEGKAYSKYILIVRNIMEIGRTKIHGQVIYGLISPFSISADDKENYFYVADDSHRKLLALSQDRQNKIPELFDENPRDYIKRSVISETTGWTIFALTNKHEVFKETRIVSITAIIIIVAILVMVSMLFSFVTNSIDIPLRVLSEKLEKYISSGYISDLSVSGHDELAKISQDFARILHRYNILNKKFEHSERAYKSEHFNYLQSQVNPHFLYNALDSINWMAYLNQNQQIYSVVKNLSTYFRLLLNNGKDIYPLETEIRLIESYLEIVNSTRNENINCHFDIAAECKSAYILKLMIQPLVENSIKHAFQDETDCHIYVSAIKKAGFLEIQVSDNGSGPKKIPFELKESDFGLSNIAERIHLFYGNRSDISFGKDRRYGGFQITITIPFKPDES